MYSAKVPILALFIQLLFVSTLEARSPHDFLTAVTEFKADDLQADPTTVLQSIADSHSKKYNCSISISFHNGTYQTSAVAGYSDFHKKTPSTLQDRAVWGSVTKMFTGSAILRHVHEGKFKLTSPIPPLVDPLLKRMAASDPSQNYTSLEELFGPEVHTITVRDLLSMQSGIPDFDTAKPSGKYPTDSLRATIYATPDKEWTPTELLNVPWVRKGKLLRPPGPQYGLFNYSSTNFMLLGMMLAEAAGEPSWRTYDQLDAIPEAIRHKYSGVRFAVKGNPEHITAMHGYDETSYNNNTKQIDVWGVDGVFAGWTASDVVATTADIAMFAYDLYGPEASIIPADMVKLMVPWDPIYGLATFNLTWTTGLKGAAGHAYGHLGATYGYQSIVSYHPAYNFSLAIATNIETDYQAQPSDTLCFAFNNMMAITEGKALPHCRYSSSGYYGGGCKCRHWPWADKAAHTWE